MYCIANTDHFIPTDASIAHELMKTIETEMEMEHSAFLNKPPQGEPEDCVLETLAKQQQNAVVAHKLNKVRPPIDMCTVAPEDTTGEPIKKRKRKGKLHIFHHPLTIANS